MSEDLYILQTTDKEAQYRSLLPQLKALLEDESDLIAKMANTSAALKEAFGFWWVGFYLVKENELVLGPFQGSVACTRIAYGKGVCGRAWELAEPIIVDDVDQFPGHIACSSASQSEIVIPVFQNKKVIAVLDVDSEHLAHFDQYDKKYLEQLVAML